MNWKMRKVASGGKIEVIVERLRMVWLKLQMHATSRATIERRNSADGNLQQDVDFLLCRRSVGNYDLAAVQRMDQELVGHKIVDLLAVFLAVPFAIAVEILAYQDRRRIVFGLDLTYLLVNDDQWRFRFEHHGGVSELNIVVACFER